MENRKRNSDTDELNSNKCMNTHLVYISNKENLHKEIFAEMKKSITIGFLELFV